MGIVAALVLLRRYLHQAPLVRRVVLAPPEGEQLNELSRRESLVTLNHLLGKHGTTTTPLVPSGKARFGDELTDVVSDGELVPAGTPVYVDEVHGNRIVVKPVDSEP